MKTIDVKNGTVTVSKEKIVFDIQKEPKKFTKMDIAVFIANLALLYFAVEELLQGNRPKFIFLLIIVFFTGFSVIQPFLISSTQKEIAASSIHKINVKRSIWGLSPDRIEVMFYSKGIKSLKIRKAEFPTKITKEEVEQLVQLLQKESKSKIGKMTNF